PAAERAKVLVTWNATTRSYPRDQSLAELFEEQVQRAPDAVAIVDGEKRLSYGELDAQANRVARALQEAGVGAGDRVALALERSIELVVAEVAVVKVGAA